jgi:MFS family permease
VSACLLFLAFLLQLFFLEEVGHEYVSSHNVAHNLQTLSTKHLPKLGISSDVDSGGCEALAQKSMASMPLQSLLTPGVVTAIANHTMISFLGISFMALLPLFLSTPVDLGGIGFTPSSIGWYLALFGIMNGGFQALFFAKIVDRLGPKRLFCLSVWCFAPVIVVFPVMSWLVRARGTVDHAITFALFAQLILVVIWDMAYGAYCNETVPAITVTYLLLIVGTIYLFITASAPAKNVLGAVYGLGQTSASMARAFGPALATSLFAFSKEHNLMNGNAVYVIFIILGGVMSWLGSQLPDELQEWDE